MSIRFKFRSSVNFDSVDIDGRPSISVRELKSKITRNKNLNLTQDFDLIFSDPVSGREYNDDDFHIPSNSSVIIKRVPAGSVPSPLPIDSVEKSGIKTSAHLIEKSGETDDFDDFGIDLCPTPEDIFPNSDVEVTKKNDTVNEKESIAASRLGWQKLKASGLSEAVPIGSGHSGTQGNISQERVEPRAEEHMKLGKGMVRLDALAVQGADLPSELKCSLCNTFFKEAVMIPCCQHSFCEKCIRQVLIEKAKCPKCSSHKFRVEDLLPNLSLRQAIEHFLESQNLIPVSETALRGYAPDGESGIQVKDFSCAVTIMQKKPGHTLSSSATERGSNQITEESCYAGSSYHNNNFVPGKVSKAVPPFKNIKQSGGERVGNPPEGAVLQGENYPFHLPLNHVYMEGGGRSFPATSRCRKVDRTCYMCGAPDHFIRDCPFSASPHSLFQAGNNTMYPGGMPGYMSPYWNTTAFSAMRPFTSMYPGMMPFNAPMVPVAPFVVSPYMSSMYHVPSHGGISRMGALVPQNRAGDPPTHSEELELQDCERRGKLLNDYPMRRQSRVDEDDDENFLKGSHHNLPSESHEYRSHTLREKSGSYSGDNLTKRLRRKHHSDRHFDEDFHSAHDRQGKNSHSSVAREWRLHHSERSNSELEDVPNTSDRYDDDRYKQNNRNPRKHHERMEQSGSDSSHSRHQRRKEKHVISGPDSDEKRSHHNRGSRLGSGVEPSSSRDKMNLSKQRDHIRSSRHCKDGAEHFQHELCDDRWKMIRPDEDCREVHHHSKRKRIL